MNTNAPRLRVEGLLRRVLVLGLLLFALLFVLAALFLGSPIARNLRIQTASGFLSSAMGQPVLVEGDVSVRLFGSLSLVVSQVRIPSKEISGTDLARLEHARFVLSPLNTLFGGLSFPEIDAHGLDVLLLQDHEGRTSWTKMSQPHASQSDSGFLQFLGTRDVDFSNMRLRVANLGTGFEFDFFLGSLQIKQDRAGGRSVKVASQGTINGQEFDASGVFPKSETFSFDGRAGALNFSLVGQAKSNGAPGDFDADIVIESPDLSDVLRTLRLQGDFEGTGEATAKLNRNEGKLDFEDIDVKLTLVEGQRVLVTGRVPDQRAGPDFDLQLRYERFPDGESPKEAVFLRDLQLSGIDLHVVGDGKTIEVASVVVETNAFEDELRHVGPFHVNEIRRTPDGRLELLDLTLTLGPLDAPFIVATGNVANLLTLEGYTLSGTLDLPANWVLPTLREEKAAEFGRASGTMKIAEVDGRAELSELRISSEGSDLWQGSLTAASRDLTALEDVEIEARLGAKDGGSFLEAIQLNPINTGPVEAYLSAARTRSNLRTLGELTIGRSAIGVDVNMRVRQQSPVVRGSVQSDQIRLSDLRNALLATRELGRAPFVWEDVRRSMKTGGNKEDGSFKPLVLRAPAKPTDDDLSDFQPLVIDRSPPPESDLSEFKPLVVQTPSGREQPKDEFKPLVLTNNAGDLSFEMFRNPGELARLLDMEIAIGIARLTGQQGISRIRSDAIMKDGRMDFGPLTFVYGGGFVTARAALDVISAPDWLRVTGRTGGWDVSEILTAFGAKAKANGTLNGQFDLTGRHTPFDAFLETATGRVTVEMEKGRFDSSLVELTGLGVVPWLFSREFRQGWTNIVCLRAPLFIDRGRITTKETVLETDRVQLVASGIIDVTNDKLELRADPRPVGRPLSRSPWPISITGKLTEPNVGIAPRRSWRALEPLSMPDARTPCVPDVLQLERPASNER